MPSAPPYSWLSEDDSDSEVEYSPISSPSSIWSEDTYSDDTMPLLSSPPSPSPTTTTAQTTWFSLSNLELLVWWLGAVILAGNIGAYLRSPTALSNASTSTVTVTVTETSTLVHHYTSTKTITTTMTAALTLPPIDPWFPPERLLAIEEQLKRDHVPLSVDERHRQDDDEYFAAYPYALSSYQIRKYYQQQQQRRASLRDKFVRASNEWSDFKDTAHAASDEEVESSLTPEGVRWLRDLERGGGVRE